MSYHKRFFRLYDIKHNNNPFTMTVMPRDYGKKYYRAYMDIRIEKDDATQKYRVYNRDEFMIEFDDMRSAESFRKQYAENMGRKWE